VSARTTADPAPPINQSVERAAAMLSYFTVDEPELTLAQLTSRLGTSRATTHRYAMALRRVGLLRYDRPRAVYTLGPRIVELATSALAGLRIIKVAGPYMERLVDEVNETVVLSIWDGEAPVVVRVDDNTDRLVRINVRTGSRLPAETSAQGKIFAAYGGGNSAGGEEGAAIRRAGLASNAMDWRTERETRWNASATSALARGSSAASAQACRSRARLSPNSESSASPRACRAVKSAPSIIEQNKNALSVRCQVF